MPVLDHGDGISEFQGALGTTVLLAEGSVRRVAKEQVESEGLLYLGCKIAGYKPGAGWIVSVLMTSANHYPPCPGCGRELHPDEFLITLMCDYCPDPMVAAVEAEVAAEKRKAAAAGAASSQDSPRSGQQEAGGTPRIVGPAQGPQPRPPA